MKYTLTLTDENSVVIGTYTVITSAEAQIRANADPSGEVGLLDDLFEVRNREQDDLEDAIAHDIEVHERA